MTNLNANQKAQQAKLEKYTVTRKRNEQKYPINEKLNCKRILRKQS